MTQEQFLTQLRELMNPIPEPLRSEWIFDYEEHFRQAVEEGLREEQITEELGDPRQLAKEMVLAYRVNQAESSNGRLAPVSRVVFAMVGLGLFNLVFVLAPYIMLLAVLLVCWTSAAASGLVALTAIYEGVIGDAFTPVQGVFVAVMLLGAGMLLGAFSRWLTMAVSRMTLRYLKFNSKVMRVKGS
ncbi:HAAS signaling domain-containing protein [Paenibacillus riograndensis]|uniref:Putative membrane protein n=1 Tax=Paenibacillus riograndensis SBR5 TaxID=1073571 RepID=A0A0E3WGH5_9BACL|nr:DUF1700 domain-containing protein [Paenibacillus riograndensis]CQR52992.1 putative membrane protein [Paenibacillus riograndensis SBR5]